MPKRYRLTRADRKLLKETAMALLLSFAFAGGFVYWLYWALYIA